MIILGIDPGISVTGWAIVEDGHVLSSGTLKVPGGKKFKTFSQKMRYIVELLGIADMKHDRYHKIYIEQTFYKFKHAETSHHKFCGILEYFIGTDKVEYIAPSSAKLKVTGSGKATKDDIQKFVTKKLETKFDSPDEADAIAIAYAGYLNEIEED